jgi:hypothetical protein
MTVLIGFVAWATPSLWEGWDGNGLSALEKSPGVYTERSRSRGLGGLLLLKLNFIFHNKTIGKVGHNFVLKFDGF